MGKQVINSNIGSSGKRGSHIGNDDPFSEIDRLKTKVRKLTVENQKFRQYLKKVRNLEKAISESDEKYETLLKSSRNAIMIIHDGIIVFSNLSGLRALGYSHISELKGKSFYDILDPLNFDYLRKKFQKLEEGKSSETAQLKLIRKDGSKALVDFTTLPVSYENQKAILAIGQNITPWKETELALRESEQRYISLFDNINSGVIILQPDKPATKFVIRDINKAALKIFKQSKNKIRGNRLDVIFKGYRKTGISKKIMMVSQTGKPRFIPAQYYQDIQFDGWLEHYIYKIPGGEIIIVIEDITEKHLATNELSKARKEWQDIFEAIGQPTFILDTRHNIIAANRSVAELTGKSQEELKKLKCFEVFHLKKGQTADGCPMEELLKSKDPQTREMEVETLSGTFMVSCTPILDTAGEINKIIHIATDITDIKKAKEELSSSLKRYQKLLDTIPYGVDEINIDGEILFTNTAHAKMLGCESEDLVGRTIFELQTTDGDRENTFNYFKKIIREHPDPTPFYGKNKTCDGHVIDIQVDWNYLEASDGELLGFITVISNITERIKFEKALNDARLKAEESDRLKSAFLTNMSHEIRTPLNGIIGFSSMLAEENLTPEKRKTYIKYIHKGASQLLSIISDIIDISKIESGQLSLVEKTFDLNNVMPELEEFFKNEIEKSGKHQLRIFFNKQGKSDKFPMITDEIKLRQVLLNLLTNAVKFTEKGIIEFGYAKVGKTMLQFYVKDTGIGIAKENQVVIFERFRQEDDTFTREFAGAGLGLAISKGILDKIGGKIWVKSEKNKGSVFYFTIPYQLPEAKPKSEADKGVTFRWDERKILVVEDDLLNIELIKATLKPTGVKLLSANDGEKAIDLFEKNSDIDLVLLDIRLPHLDGYSVAKYMKKLRQDIPILAYSAYAMDKEKSKASEAGIDKYLSKPSRPGEILRAISVLLD